MPASHRKQVGSGLTENQMNSMRLNMTEITRYYISINLEGQPYRFGGKELITANGLNEYDFGVRMYYSAVPGFTKPDPMCEKYYWLSPYLYYTNNPVNAFDPDGNIVIFVNGMHFGDGGKSEYWNGVNITIKQLLQDKIPTFPPIHYLINPIVWPEYPI